MGIAFTIQLNPITKKNSIDMHHIVDKAGRERWIPAPSKRYKEYETACWQYIPSIKDSIKHPVNIEAKFYMQTRRHVDLVNLQEALLDILVKYEIIDDDNCRIVASMDGSRVFFDKDNPRTEVVIEDVEVSEQWDE